MTDDRVRVTLFSGEQGDGSVPFLGNRLVDVIAWLQSMLLNVPEEHRGSVEFEIDSFEGQAGIEISYWRDATAAERGEQIAMLEAQERRKREEEMAILRTLSARYPNAI